MENGNTKPTHHVNIHDLETGESPTYFSGTHAQCQEFLTKLQEEFPWLWEEAEQYEFPAPCISETHSTGDFEAIRTITEDYTVTYAYEDGEADEDRCHFAPCTGEVFKPGEEVFLLYFHANCPGGWTIASLDLCRSGYYQLGDTHSYRNDF